MWFRLVQLLSRVWLFANSWTAVWLPCPSPTPGTCSKYVHSVADAIQPSHPLLSPSPSAFNLSSIKVFSKESVLCITWPKHWSFSFTISPSNEYSGLISFRIDCFDLLVVQGTLKSLLQHHGLKTLILWHSAFLIVQLSHPYKTTGKTVALTRWNFVGKTMPLLFNMLSRLVIVLLPRSKHLLISWLQSPSTVISEPKKIKPSDLVQSSKHDTHMHSKTRVKIESTMLIFVWPLSLLIMLLKHWRG